jgi:hypothetical protein
MGMHTEPDGTWRERNQRTDRPNGINLHYNSKNLLKNKLKQGRNMVQYICKWCLGTNQFTQEYIKLIVSELIPEYKESEFKMPEYKEISSKYDLFAPNNKEISNDYDLFA